jgi:D-3-phosphoglycerate dehydrogenase
MIRIAIPDDSPPVLAPSRAWAGLKERAQLDYHDTLPFSENVLVERIRDAQAVLNIRSSSLFTERVFAACPKMRLLSVWGTGTDHIDLAAAARYGVTVTNTPGVSAISIAEHALALLFAVARRVPEMDAATRLGTWERGRFVQLYGKTCGVIGYGAVGREFARMAEGIGMRVIQWTMHPERYPDVEFVDLDELYQTSDAISVHLRLSDATRDFIGAEQFARMKTGAILINTARGAIVNEAAMLQALVAVALVAVLAWLLSSTAKTMCSAEKAIEIASYGLIAAFGARLVWTKGGGFISALQAPRPAPAIAGAAHHHGHDHDAGRADRRCRARRVAGVDARANGALILIYIGLPARPQRRFAYKHVR